MRNFMRSSGIVSLLSFLLVLGGTEVGVRQLSAGLPVDPGKWPRIEIAQKLDRLDREIRRGEDFEVVFVGSSVMAGGVDPVQFTNASGVSSYNAAWAGGTGRTSAMWALDVVEPLAEPEVILLGVQSGELNDNGPKNQITHRKFIESPGYQQTTTNLARRFEGKISKISDLIRYRLAFRTPTVLFKKDRKALQAVEARKEIGARGRRVEEPVKYRFNLKFQTGFPEKNLANLSYGGREYRAIVRLHNELADRGVKLVVMVTAVTDDYYTIHADPEGDKRRFHKLIERFHRETGATVIDASDAFPSWKPFRDPVHLDVEGRRAMSHALAKRWKRIANAESGWFEVTCSGSEEEPTCRLRRGR